MPFEIQVFDLGVLPAGEDLSEAQFLPVKLQGASGEAEVVKLSSSGEASTGILQNNPEDGEAASVRILGVSQAYLAEAVSVGNKLMGVPTGLGVATTAKYQIAVALQDGSAGDLISVLMISLAQVPN